MRNMRKEPTQEELVHHIDYVTPDMIKTKITHNSISTNVSNQTSTHNINDDVPVSTNALPTTGRPVLMTPKGPISMRNMRKEPTQEELVHHIDYVTPDMIK